MKSREKLRGGLNTFNSKFNFWNSFFSYSVFNIFARLLSFYVQNVYSSYFKFHLIWSMSLPSNDFDLIEFNLYKEAT